jgi:hypothetical protein
MKLTVAFHNFVNVPKNWKQIVNRMQTNKAGIAYQQFDHQKNK